MQGAWVQSFAMQQQRKKEEEERKKDTKAEKNQMIKNFFLATL